jgi:hypothetical protein
VNVRRGQAVCVLRLIKHGLVLLLRSQFDRRLRRLWIAFEKEGLVARAIMSRKILEGIDAWILY